MTATNPWDQHLLGLLVPTTWESEERKEKTVARAFRVIMLRIAVSLFDRDYLLSREQ
jgi:hypothetical protein